MSLEKEIEADEKERTGQISPDVKALIHYLRNMKYTGKKDFTTKAEFDAYIVKRKTRGKH
jgi:hypothetical protein